jgi:hypothetical protein
MALLDDGPHTATVYLEEYVTDSYGNPTTGQTSTTSQVVRCRMQPINSARDPGSDRRLGGVEAWRFSARAAPLGKWSRVEWRGHTYHVNSGPFRHDETATTIRVTATLVRDS